MRLVTLLLLSAFISFAQLTDGVATSVTRTVTLTADTADCSIVAGAGLDTTQQQIAQIFLDAGVSGLSNSGTALSQNYDYSTNPYTIQTLVLYQFTFSVPAAGLKDAAKILETLRTKPPDLLKGFQYSAALNASQATVDAMRQTLLPQLFADAQKKAQTLAAAAGLKLGGLKGVSETFYATGYSNVNWIGTSSTPTSLSAWRSERHLMKHLYLLFIVLSCVATAQTLEGINAPASRTVTLTADEAAFTITVAATLDSTQQQVKQALQNAGLPNPTVVATGLGQDVSPYFAGAVQMLYSATVALPAGSAMDTAKGLEALRTHLPAPLQSLQYAVAFNPSLTTVDAMRQVVMPQLLEDSRKLAQSLAAATGVKLGAIRAIGDSAGVYAILVPTAAFRAGDFSALQSGVLLGIPSPLPSSTQVTFSLNVVFATAP